MTTYRCVCPMCTTFIRSFPVFSYEEELEWHRHAEEWLARHICGGGDGDGVEDHRTFEQFTEQAELGND